MLISDLTNSGPAPVLEQMLRFAGQRQRILAQNVANVGTPDFRPWDVSPAKFQAQLAAAVEDRRKSPGGDNGPLVLKDTDEVKQAAGGGLEVTPKTSRGGILFQDRNNRDYIRLMQDVAENSLAFRAATDLMRWHEGMIRSAISQRV